VPWEDLVLYVKLTVDELGRLCPVDEGEEVMAKRATIRCPECGGDPCGVGADAGSTRLGNEAAEITAGSR
jgi:hypothetical protein